MTAGRLLLVEDPDEQLFADTWWLYCYYRYTCDQARQGQVLRYADRPRMLTARWPDEASDSHRTDLTGEL